MHESKCKHCKSFKFKCRHRYKEKAYGAHGMRPGCFFMLGISELAFGVKLIIKSKWFYFRNGKPRQSDV